MSEQHGRPLAAGEPAGICPDCGARLEVKRRRKDGAFFVGCATWPACDFTDKVPATLEMRRIGAPSLPGFGLGED